MSLDPRAVARTSEKVEVGGSTLLAFPAGRHAVRLAQPAGVTACVPVWNGGATLERCLHCLAAQTHTDMDVVIVDNVSTDDTFARCAEFAAERANVTVYRNEANLGRVGNWNRCLDLATGRYVKFAMVNDMLTPDCVERFVAALDAHPGATMACSAVRLVYADGSTDGGAIFPRPTLVPGRQAIEFGLRVHNLGNGPSGQLLRAAVLREHAIRFDDTFSWAADWELAMRLFLHGDLVYLPEDLSVVDLGAAGRFHNQAFSPAHFRDECRVTVRFAAESGLEVSDELAAAAAARIEKLYAGHAPRVPDAVRSAFAADLARTRRALRERISWEATARRVFAADALEIAAPAERLDEARALAAAVESTGCAARVHPSEGPAIVVAPEGDPAAAVEPSELPWPVDGERFAPGPPAGARPHTFLAVLDRWDGWQTTIEAYVAEFADADPVSLAVVATPAAGADAERMFADVSALLADLGRDPAAIPDLSLLVAEAEPALYRMADCLISAGGGRRDAEAAACGLPRIAPGEGIRERLRWACGHADAAADAARRERAAVIERHGYESVARRLAAALAAA